MKTAVVTGITSDISRALAKRLEKDGWQVVGIARDTVDLSDLKAVANLADSIAKEHVHLNALIHVAGIWHDDESAFGTLDLEDYPWEMIADTMNVGVTSFMVLAARLLPNLAKDGVVIGVSGTFSDGATGWLPYYTSKRALEDFLVGLSEDYPYGPRVYGVSPADTATKAYQQFFPQSAGEAQPPAAVAEVIAGLIDGAQDLKSGTILQVRGNKVSSGFHV